ncbi:MAG: ribosomal protein S18-alanine N-acetyltransferase [Clostridiales bacterium]|nr:ribosomal protein S18-alanine N-acetyltransferase [Clostridiales bacterium]MCD7801522.1 ribosomal protein S18-alanine N-acetyltransferase [Clostridiales bacterium]
MSEWKPVMASVPEKARQPIPYQLVPMDRELVPQIAALERQIFSMPWTEEMLNDELDSLTSSCIVAVTGEREVLGYASLTVVLDEGYINNIAVKEEYRRQGLASDLLGVFLRFAQAQHLSFLTLEVRESNHAARDLYTKFGFQETGRRKNYYDKPTEDALLMTRFLRQEEDEQ